MSEKKMLLLNALISLSISVCTVYTLLLGTPLFFPESYIAVNTDIIKGSLVYGAIIVGALLCFLNAILATFVDDVCYDNGLPLRSVLLRGVLVACFDYFLTLGLFVSAVLYLYKTHDIGEATEIGFYLASVFNFACLWLFRYIKDRRQAND